MEMKYSILNSRHLCRSCIQCLFVKLVLRYINQKFSATILCPSSTILDRQGEVNVNYKEIQARMFASASLLVHIRAIIGPSKRYQVYSAAKLFSSYRTKPSHDAAPVESHRKASFHAEYVHDVRWEIGGKECDYVYILNRMSYS